MKPWTHVDAGSYFDRAACGLVYFVTVFFIASAAIGQIELPQPPDTPAPDVLRYSEEDFFRKAATSVSYEFARNEDFRQETSLVGNRRFYSAQQGDTFLDLARFYGLGYNEIYEANRNVDPWLPDEAHSILLATEWVLPRVEQKGVVVNIPEMRLYHFQDDAEGGSVSTYPVGLGRDEWRTPAGRFKIMGKTKNPTWVIPESIREERMREKGLDERSIAGGDPRNPLGKYRLELTMPGYRIHGTNQTYGVGMQVSHGCVRLYPEDIERLFTAVKVGSPGEFIYQPVKLGARDGRIFVEVHRDIYTLIPGLYGEAMRLVRERGWERFVDASRLQRAVETQSGVPYDVTLKQYRNGPKRDETPPAHERPLPPML